MAEQDESEKTEEPTEKKLQDARKKGDVARSQEVASFVALTAAGGVIIGLSGFVTSVLTEGLTGFFAHAHQMSLGPAGARRAAAVATRVTALALAAPLALLAVAAVLSQGLQTGFLFTAERMKPELSKISPIGGAKRLFGPSALANFAKGVAKLLVVGAASFAVVWPQRDRLIALVGAPPLAILLEARELVVMMLIAALAVFALVAAADFVGQRMSWMKKQRMSRRDVKDEHKNAEGDPTVKARLRQIRMERARKRMMAAVPDATVVIANPTHYAVALKYDPELAPAPICVAKGVDVLALKIREIAEAHDVPVMVEPPLARALYETAELDRPIPESHYIAVARVIGAVLQVAQGRRGAGAPRMVESAARHARAARESDNVERG